MSKKDKDELLLDLDPRQIAIPNSNTFAVYRSPEDKQIHTYPVILFGVFEAIERDGDGRIVNSEDHMIHGLVSQLDGLVIAEEVEDLLFIGYWCKDAQPDVEVFLNDHESLAKSGNVNDDPEEDDDDQAEEDEEDEEE